MTLSNTKDRVEGFLSSLPLFQDTDAAHIACLSKLSTELPVARGTILYRRGDACNGLYVVWAGQIKLSLQSNRGDERVMELAQHGEAFGEAPLFSGQPHILTAEALLDSQVIHLPRDPLLAAIQHDPQLAFRVITYLGGQLYRRLNEFEEYVLASGTERVIGYLVRGLNGAASFAVDCITLPANKGLIASRLNLTHEHFSRILRDLMAEGLIEVRGREVRILSWKRLRDYANAYP